VLTTATTGVDQALALSEPPEKLSPVDTQPQEPQLSAEAARNGVGSSTGRGSPSAASYTSSHSRFSQPRTGPHRPRTSLLPSLCSHTACGPLTAAWLSPSAGRGSFTGSEVSVGSSHRHPLNTPHRLGAAGLDGPERVYECEFGSGFRGTFEEVRLALTALAALDTPHTA